LPLFSSSSSSSSSSYTTCSKCGHHVRLQQDGGPHPFPRPYLAFGGRFRFWRRLGLWGCRALPSK
jgi:hypothetical protein